MRKHLFFIHIPKTAGSSIRWSFEQALGAGSTRFFSTGKKVEQLEALDLSSLAVVGGHIPLWQFRECSPCRELRWKTVALLREPRARFLSLYNFLTHSSHPEHRQFQGMPLDEFAGMCRKRQRPDFEMCWYFHPSGRFDEALKMIRKNSVEIYVMEDIALFYDAMERFFGAPLPETTLNRSPSLVTTEDLDGLDLAFLDEDTKLYEAARSRYFQYAQRLRLYRGKMADEIRDLWPVRRLAVRTLLFIRKRVRRWGF